MSDLSDQRVHLMYAPALNDDQLLVEKADKPNYTLGRRRVQEKMMMIVLDHHISAASVSHVLLVGVVYAALVSMLRFAHKDVRMLQSNPSTQLPTKCEFHWVFGLGHIPTPKTLDHDDNQ